MTDLFSSIQVKDLKLKNRMVMPPMCMYSVDKKDGKATDWHVHHYQSRALGGAGLVIIEMTDVDPDGRITDNDLGLWEDGQVEGIKKIVDSCHKVGAKVAIQIAHAGRKAQDAIDPVAPSPIPFNDNFKTPRELTQSDIDKLILQFQHAARRAVDAGVDAIELHGAHGYLIHEFQSPYTNKRKDKYGQNYAAFGVEVVSAVKEVIPDEMPLLFRISAVEYVKEGYKIEHALSVAKQYKDAGVDVFHVSSGGEGDMEAKIPFEEGYQVDYAQSFKEQLDIPVIAVGKLFDATLANEVIKEEKADLVAVGRGILRDPYWPLHAAEKLDLLDKEFIPKQYLRGF